MLFRNTEILYKARTKRPQAAVAKERDSGVGDRAGGQGVAALPYRPCMGCDLAYTRSTSITLSNETANPKLS